MSSAGYSGTPLWKKIGVKEGMTVLFLDAPDGMAQFVVAGGPDVLAVDRIADAGCTHLFTTSRQRLEAVCAQAMAEMPRDGMLWVSWPKKAAKIPTEVTEDVIREVCLPLGLVDVKVCAVDAKWSGLKLMIRKDLR